MNEQALRDAFDAIATTAGVHGSALVEAASGMVWMHAGGISDLPVLAEAVSNYWRMSDRLAAPLQDLGELRAGILIHAQGRITMLPCGSNMILVAVTDQNPRIDWRHWQKQSGVLARLIDMF